VGLTPASIPVQELSDAPVHFPDMRSERTVLGFVQLRHRDRLPLRNGSLGLLGSHGACSFVSGEAFELLGQVWLVVVRWRGRGASSRCPMMLPAPEGDGRKSRTRCDPSTRLTSRQLVLPLRRRGDGASASGSISAPSDSNSALIALRRDAAS